MPAAVKGPPPQASSRDHGTVTNAGHEQRMRGRYGGDGAVLAKPDQAPFRELESERDAARLKHVEQSTEQEDVTAESVFIGGGELAQQCRTFDWAATALGPVDQWPAALRAMVRTCLECPFPMAVLGEPDLTLIYNDGYRRALGTKHPGALGQPGRAVLAEVWEELNPFFDRMRAGGPPAYAEDAEFVLERTGEDGAERAPGWFTFSVSPVRDHDGGIIAFVTIASETTDRVAARMQADQLVRALEFERSRLEYVFRQAPSFLAVTRGPTHVFELANEAYYQLVGHRQLIGLPVSEALPEIRDQGFEELVDAVLRTGEPFVGREYPVQVQRTPGAPLEEHFVDFTYLPVIEADGSRSGIIAHGTDVTEQVHARREVERLLAESERARAEADAANRTKSEFLATMSHEFRTPLNAIVGYAQLLDMGVLGPATASQHAHLERLQSSARHLLQLVDDVLDVAKVDADRLDVRHDILMAGSAIAAAVALIHPQATAKGVRLFDFGAEPVSARYRGDEHRVRQILVNLLSNAVKFTPAGGEARITCGSASELAPGAQPHRGAGEGGPSDGNDGEAGAWVFIRVEDTGPGIAPELAGRMFEPFVQGDSALTREKGGSGLGLAISRRLARLMGGDLTVWTRPGAGAAFTLWLPAAERDPSRAAGDAGGIERLSFRTPAGMVSIASASDPAAQALDDAAFAVLHALGTRLAMEAETVAERYVAALRADGRFPGVRELPAVQLRNHATPTVGLLATQLMVIGETRGQAPELLGDGGQVQRLMDELHGAQRHRLGWSEGDIEREVQFMLAEVKRALQAAVDTTATEGIATAPGTREAAAPELSVQAVRTATRYAADVVHHVMERGLRTTLRAYRFAKAAEAD